MVVVIHADMRALGYCNRGARQWFARHQLNWSDFLNHGIGADRLLSTGDAMAEEVVAVAKQRLLAGEDHGRSQ